MHLAGTLVGAVCLGASGLVASTAISFVFFCVAVMGIKGAIGVFWAVPAAILRGGAAVGGLALINAVQLRAFVSSRANADIVTQS